jgi:hypothetical protein
VLTTGLAYSLLPGVDPEVFYERRKQKWYNLLELLTMQQVKIFGLPSFLFILNLPDRYDDDAAGE